MLTLTLPWPPSQNRLYRAVAGRSILSAAGRNYVVKASNALAGTLAKPLTERLAVVVDCHPPTRMGKRRWDVMNREKILSDTLTALRVWKDDSQVDDFRIRRAAPTPDGCVVVRIEVLDSDAKCT